MEYFIYVSMLAYILVSVLVTLYVRKSEDQAKKQKIAQVIIVWAIPIIGALVVYFILKSLNEPITEDKPKFGGGPRDSGWANPPSNSGENS